MARVYKPDPAISDMAERAALGAAYGLPQTIAARVAGFANAAVAGVRLSQDERFRAVVRARRNRRIDKLASLSLWELEVMLKDRSVSPAVRFNCAKLCLSLAGHVEPKAPEDDANLLNGKTISEMSIDELDRLIAHEKGKRASDAKPIIDQQSDQMEANPLITIDKAHPE